MQDSYFKTHYYLGAYLKRLIQLSPITFLEVAVALRDSDTDWDRQHNPYKFELFAIIPPNELVATISYEWKEKPEQVISLYEVNDKELSYVEQQFNYYELMDDLLVQFPLLQDQDFLIYLLNVLNIDIAGVGYHRFNVHTLGIDIVSFWGKSTKSYFLSKKLEESLSNKSENAIFNRNTKI